MSGYPGHFLYLHRRGETMFSPVPESTIPITENFNPDSGDYMESPLQIQNTGK